MAIKKGVFEDYIKARDLPGKDDVLSKRKKKFIFDDIDDVPEPLDQIDSKTAHKPKAATKDNGPQTVDKPKAATKELRAQSWYYPQWRSLLAWI